MRDVILAMIVMIASVATLRRPWIGVMFWTWVSMMNPHRFTYGFAYSMPIAAIAAVTTLVGLLLTRDRDSPFKGTPVVLLGVFMVWITVSWLLGLDPEADYAQWNKVMKIFLMILVTLALLRTKLHIVLFIWVMVLSLGFLGIKGGVFTISTGGSYRVWGPPGTFIEENNAFAVAVIMTIPLMRFLQLQLTGRTARMCMTIGMVLMAASALGSQSRGALLAIGAMGLWFWWRMKSNRALTLIPILAVGALLITFMPDQWTDRMATIGEYREDESAMGRLAAWNVGWGVAKNHFFGVGFNAARMELFELYSPYPMTRAFVSHSIYFQMMGLHGFIGLFLFLAIFVSTYANAGRLWKQCVSVPEARWCSDLGAMVQVSLVGYAAGGAFLDLAYFDLPYNLMVAIVLTQVWWHSRAWEREVNPAGGWWRRIGLGPSADVVSVGAK